MIFTRDYSEFYHKNTEDMIALIMSRGIRSVDLATDIYHQWILTSLKYNTLDKFDPDRGVPFESYICTSLYNIMGAYKRNHHLTYTGIENFKLEAEDTIRYEELVNDVKAFRSTLSPFFQKLLDQLFIHQSCTVISKVMNTSPQYIHQKRKELYILWKEFNK